MIVYRQNLPYDLPICNHLYLNCHLCWLKTHCWRTYEARKVNWRWRCYCLSQCYSWRMKHWNQLNQYCRVCCDLAPLNCSCSSCPWCCASQTLWSFLWFFKVVFWDIPIHVAGCWFWKTTGFTFPQVQFCCLTWFCARYSIAFFLFPVGSNGLWAVIFQIHDWI